MLAPASLTVFSWSLKLCIFIIVNVLDALDKILRKEYRLSNCYQ